MSATAAKPDTMVLTHRVRLQPTREQHRALERVLEQQRQLYNAALEERIECYRKTGKTLTDIDQSRSLTLIRADDPEFAGVQRRIQRATLTRLNRAFKSFFKRAKAGAGASSGFPKFKGREHFDGFGFDAPLQISFDGRRLRFAGVPGGLRVSKRDMRRVPPMTAGAGDGRGGGRRLPGRAGPAKIGKGKGRAGCRPPSVGARRQDRPAGRCDRGRRGSARAHGAAQVSRSGAGRTGRRAGADSRQGAGTLRRRGRALPGPGCDGGSRFAPG